MLNKIEQVIESLFIIIVRLKCMRWISKVCKRKLQDGTHEYYNINSVKSIQCLTWGYLFIERQGCIGWGRLDQINLSTWIYVGSLCSLCFTIKIDILERHFKTNIKIRKFYKNFQQFFFTTLNCCKQYCCLIYVNYAMDRLQFSVAQYNQSNKTSLTFQDIQNVFYLQFIFKMEN